MIHVNKIPMVVAVALSCSNKNESVRLSKTPEQLYKKQELCATQLITYVRQ